MWKQDLCRNSHFQTSFTFNREYYAVFHNIFSIFISKLLRIHMKTYPVPKTLPIALQDPNLNPYCLLLSTIFVPKKLVKSRAIQNYTDMLALTYLLLFAPTETMEPNAGDLINLFHWCCWSIGVSTVVVTTVVTVMLGPLRWCRVL